MSISDWSSDVCSSDLERTRHMNAVTITAKGQVTLRKELLRHLGVHPGDKISFDKLPGGEIKIRAIRPSGKIEDFFGSLKREGQRPISIEEMNEAIEKGWISEEHTSEIQSLMRISYAVFCLKNKKKIIMNNHL